ncbi:MAG: hypothetical protein U5K79_16205 [Cyclobacteriaceae bacterium]|nr:hypothetical protein [Cyclobacteriaceae bacterium]
MAKRFSLLFVLILFFFNSLAQREDENILPQISTKKDSASVAKVESKNFRITPFIAPSVSPEVGLMVTLGGLMSFKLDKEDKKIQSSSIPFSVGYSTTGAIIANFRPSLFFKNDKNRLMGDLWIKDMPDNYWGIGYDAGKSPSMPDSTTEYQRLWYQIFLKYSHRFGEYFYAGLLLDYNATSATDPGQRLLDDPNYQTYGADIDNISAGLLVQYDSRDITVNAYKGLFLELSSNFYSSAARGKPTYNVIIMDYRQYKQIKRPGSTLAWQAKTRIATGKVPWPEMSQIGTPFDLRGYRWGRYRDVHSLFGIAEYRYMFMRKTPRKDGDMMSRFGLAGWLAAGTVMADFGDMRNWLPNAGIGFRFEVQKRMNARIDYGIGNDSNSVYISFNEAF